jgi:hypothetical protein
LQYYDDQFPTAKEQRDFEKNLFNKTHRANGKIFVESAMKFEVYAQYISYSMAGKSF